ncbi:MAG: hypothetical protein SAL70_26410 [Scytonema sp. PMC 1070.18]|nr:hypothetical protein [Scytonema sp. PMC 1070.18]
MKNIIIDNNKNQDFDIFTEKNKFLAFFLKLSKKGKLILRIYIDLPKIKLYFIHKNYNCCPELKFGLKAKTR